MTLVDRSPSQYSSRSFPDTSALLPTLTNVDRPSCRAVASSRMVRPRAPLCESRPMCPLGGTSTKFALIGQLNTGATILTIGVQDIGALSQYSGAITGVAQANYQLQVVTGYALALTR